MNRFGALLFVLVLPLSASLLGCFCEEFVLTEEFENFCEDGVPCGWTATGPVTRVPTFHSNVFGVAIPAGTTLTSLEGFGTSRPSILVRCEEGASLTINGNRASAPSDSFEWLSSGSEANTTISVGGSGQCIVDDVGFLTSCPLD